MLCKWQKCLSQPTLPQFDSFAIESKTNMIVRVISSLEMVWSIKLAPIHSGANQIRARCCSMFWLRICRYHSGEQNLVDFPPVRTKKCPLMQSGSSFTTVDDAFDKGICPKQEKPSSKLTFSKFEISNTFLNSKMNLFCSCNSKQ